jgi:tellurite resistance protein
MLTTIPASQVPDMNALYSLYDALVSINVPTDKAKAVVDAMERDMTTLLASKSDIAMLRQDLDGARVATKSDIAMLRQEADAARAATKSDIAMLRQDLDGGRLETKNDIAMLRQDLETTRTLFSKDLELLRSSMAIRLGSMLIVGLGILFTALKLT